MKILFEVFFANQANADLIKIEESHGVPFRVPQALIIDNYLEELSKKRGLEVSENEALTFRFKALIHLPFFRILDYWTASIRQEKPNKH